MWVAQSLHLRGSVRKRIDVGGKQASVEQKSRMVKKWRRIPLALRICLEAGSVNIGSYDLPKAEGKFLLFPDFCPFPIGVMGGCPIAGTKLGKTLGGTSNISEFANVMEDKRFPRWSLKDLNMCVCVGGRKSTL